MKGNNGVSRAKRKKVFIRDNYRCWYCGCQVYEFAQCEIRNMKTMATVDHIEARVLGGDHSLENLVTSCLSCNSLKSTRSVEEFKSFIQGRTREGQALKSLRQSKAVIYTLSDETIRDHFDSIEQYLKSKIQKIIFYGEQTENVQQCFSRENLEARAANETALHSATKATEGICFYNTTNQKEEPEYVQ